MCMRRLLVSYGLIAARLAGQSRDHVLVARVIPACKSATSKVDVVIMPDASGRVGAGELMRGGGGR